MKIILNGTITEINSSISLEDFLTQQNIDSNTIVVEYNEKILTKSDFIHTILKQDDQLEILRFVGGG